MQAEELLNIIAAGEDSKHQFKADVTSADALAAEMIAFSNAAGGLLLIGVQDDGGIAGLDVKDVARINGLISNAAAHKVRPPIHIATKNVLLPEGVVMAVTIEQGPTKPYQDDKGHFWMKEGADKRRSTAREGLQRIFQESTIIQGDETLVHNTSIEDVDTMAFADFFQRRVGQPLEGQTLPVPRLLENMRLMRNGQLTVTGALLVAKTPELVLPLRIVKAVSFPGNKVTDVNYIDSKDITGTLPEVYQQSVKFALSSIFHLQNGQSVNSLGEPEIPRLVFEELIANALVHRDYFESAAIRLLVFANRIEIISPGHLPNNLTVEDIKTGKTSTRNTLLAAYAPDILPYRALGKGIPRALEAYPDIEFIDDRGGASTFTAIIHRKPVVARG